MRLNKFLAHSTGLSRRQADEAIEQGRVTINDTVATLGNEVAEQDTIALDGTVVSEVQEYTYIIFHKPVGVVCSRNQQGDTKTIYDILPKEYRALKTVGRLDKDSSGIILMTDDGDLAHELTHPKFAKEKVYKIELDKPLSKEDIEAINSGVELEDGRSQLTLGNVNTNSATVTMHEGRNRQIRRTFEYLGYEVVKLHRTKFGDHELEDLAPGQAKEIQISR